MLCIFLVKDLSVIVEKSIVPFVGDVTCQDFFCDVCKEIALRQGVLV